MASKIIFAAQASAAAPSRALLESLFSATTARTSIQMLEQAAQRARDAGLVVVLLGLQGPAPADELAQLHAAIASQCLRHGRAAAPTLFLSAGPVDGHDAHTGAAQFALALALALDQHPAIHAFVVSGGMDGQAAGRTRYVAPDTVLRLRAAGVDPGQHVRDGTAHSALAQLGELHTGATLLSEAIVVRALLVTQQ